MSGAAAIPPDWERAVAYGDGLFETIAVFDGHAPLLQYHWSRLGDSARRLQLPLDLASIEADFCALASETRDAVIKLVVARRGGGRGYDPRQANGCSFQLRAFPLPHYPQARVAEGIRLHLCRQRLSANPALAGIKHLNRLEQVLAAAEWSRNVADEGLMLDASGAVIEGTMSNVFLLRDGQLFTPKLDQCGVAGVMRANLMQTLAPACGYPVVVQRLTVGDLLAADAVLVCNSIFGIWPVQRIGVSELACNAGLTHALWQLLAPLGYARLYG